MVNGPRFHLELEPVASTGWRTRPEQRLRLALKTLLRGFGLRCVSVRPVAPPDESQRAMVAAKLANMLREDTLKRGSRSPNLDDGKVSLAKAADLLNVSRTQVADAKLCLEHANEETPVSR